MGILPELVDGLPDICGSEHLIEQAMRSQSDVRAAGAGSRVDFGQVRSAAAIALHMHQPLIPAGGDAPRHSGNHQQPEVHDG